MFDLYNRISVITDPLLSSGAASKTNQTGTTIDTTALNGGAQAMIVGINVNTVTDGNHTFTLQDSPDGVTFTTVAAPFVQNQTPLVVTGVGNGANSCIKIGYLGTQRYLRTITVETGTTGAVYSVFYVAGKERNEPAA